MVKFEFRTKTILDLGWVFPGLFVTVAAKNCNPKYVHKYLCNAIATLPKYLYNWIVKVLNLFWL